MTAPRAGRPYLALATAERTLPLLLKEAMNSRGMNQATLARLSHVSRPAVNQALKGQRIPGEQVTKAWDAVLGTGDALTTQAALDRATRRRSNSGPGRPHVAVPHQLPAAPVRLLGRHRETTRIGSDLITDGIPIVIIAGSVGVGTTSLAAAVAAQAREAYPDGLLYAHGHGHTPGRTPAAAEDILAGWLAALGVRTIPEHASDRTELYRRLLQDRQLLIIIDDAASSDQIRALLPGDSPSKVLATTRHRLSLAVTNGARIHTLAPLGNEHARDMLTSLIVDTPPHTHENHNQLEHVLAMCAGVPLAIAAAAELINTRGLRPALNLLNHQPLAALDTTVHDAPDRSLTAGYHACWNCLSTPARDMLIALVGRQPVHTPTKDHDTATETARDELVREHLISNDQQLSPLLRAWIHHHTQAENHTIDVA